MTNTDRDAVERLAGVCERPHGNPTFGEKAEIATTLRALLAAKEAAEAERDEKDEAFSARIDEMIDKCDALATCAESARARAEAAEAEAAALREALTPSGDTKAAYIGEFDFTLTLSHPRLGEDCRKVSVPWTTIKQIMKAILERATIDQPKEGDRDDGCRGGSGMTENACRHYLGMYPDNRPSCAVGRDVRAWAVRCNGGSELGIALRLPCTRQHQDSETPLFDCPSLDRKTQEEVDRQREEITARIDRLFAALPKLNVMKVKMIANNLASAVATCPWCDEKDALHLGVALGVNNHMRVSCKSCGEGFIE